VLGFLSNDWEDKTRREVLSMKQGSQTFWTFATRLRARNALLKNTDSYLDNAKLRHQLEAGMDDRLSTKCLETKKIKDLNAWLNEVKRIEEELIEDRKEWESLAKANREFSRRQLCSRTHLVVPISIQFINPPFHLRLPMLQ
jgi:hypothetical protein